MYKSILYNAVAYILLCKLNYGYHNQHIFINIFQTEHFSAVKFAMGRARHFMHLFAFFAKLLKFSRKYEKCLVSGVNLL